jgi:hypothetical protein
MTNLVGPIVQAVANRIPNFGPARSGIIAAALIMELVSPNLANLGKNALITLLQKTVPISERDGLTKIVNIIDIKGFIKGLNKVNQIVACLGATRVFSSYWVSIPATCVIISSWYLTSFFFVIVNSGLLESANNENNIELNNILMRIKNPVSLVNNVFLGLDVCAKVVNIFAITLFAKQLFSNKHASAVAASVAFAAMLSMSAYNLYPHFQSKKEVPKNSQDI